MNSTADGTKSKVEHQHSIGWWLALRFCIRSCGIYRPRSPHTHNNTRKSLSSRKGIYYLPRNSYPSLHHADQRQGAPLLLWLARGQSLCCIAVGKEKKKHASHRLPTPPSNFVLAGKQLYQPGGIEHRQRGIPLQQHGRLVLLPKRQRFAPIA